MAILYLLSAAALWTGMMAVRKSGEKQNFPVWLFITAMLFMGFQALYGGVLGKLGVPLTMPSMAAGNLAAAAACFVLAARKGRQAYEIRLSDAVSVLVILGIICLYSISKYGKNLDVIDYVTVDAASHANSAATVALEHRLPMNLYFSSLNTGMAMQVYQALTGAGRFDLYRVFNLCESAYTALAAMLFWGLMRQRCGEGRWQRLVPLLLTPFYWAGYPLYSTLFGFSYLGMSVCILLVIVSLLHEYCRDRISPVFFILGMNLMLYGIFVCYTMFVPVAFFGAFGTMFLKMCREKGRKLVSRENILTMLKIFLFPTVLGMLYSFGNLEALGPDGGIRNEGGCYNDIYSNFIILVPFMALGIYFLVSRREGGYLLPTALVTGVMIVLLMAGLMTRKVSVYYYTKINSVFWMIAWILTGECILGLMRHCRWAVLFPLFFYGVVFMGKYWDAWMDNASGLAGRVQVWNFCDLIMINNTYFNFESFMTPDTMELYRYADEHFAPGEAAAVNRDRENGWFRMLTGQEETFTSASYEEFVKEIGEKNIQYICAGYGAQYDRYREFLDKQTVLTENSAGKVFRVTAMPSETE